MTEVFILLIAFQFKHLIADYYLQFPYMYENKGKSYGWAIPLFHHSSVHALFTLIIVMFIAPAIALPLAFFDLVTHFITDRWKATRSDEITTSQFWYNLGIDQMIHHTIGIIIIFASINF